MPKNEASAADLYEPKLERRCVWHTDVHFTEEPRRKTGPMVRSGRILTIRKEPQRYRDKADDQAGDQKQMFKETNHIDRSGMRTATSPDGSKQILVRFFGRRRFGPFRQAKLWHDNRMTQRHRALLCKGLTPVSGRRRLASGGRFV